MNGQTLSDSKASRRAALVTCGVIGTTAAAPLLLGHLTALAAEPSGGGAAKAGGPATLEAIPGSPVKRIRLTAKAADRLGIATDKVSEQVVPRRQMVGGLIVPPQQPPATTPRPSGGSFGGMAAAPGATGGTAGAAAAGGKLPSVGFGAFGRTSPAATPASPAQPLKTVAAPEAPPAPAKPVAGDVWVLVSLSAAEWERTAKDRPAKLLPLATREALSGERLAQPTGAAPLEDVKRSMLSVFYIVPGKEHGLALNTRMRVELPLVGPEDKQKVVPYGAVYYDASGTPWVYVNPSPLVYERQKIGVERIVGDLAVLSEGPAVGTTIVSVGAAMLFGIEIFGK
jgi:hypothetical protein